MIVLPTERRGGTIVLPYDTDDGRIEATFEVPPGVEIDDGPDPAIVAGWLHAMARREPLRVEAPVSPRLLSGMRRAADIVLNWDRALHPDRHWYGRVPLEASPRELTPAGARAGSMSFFTGGVDSFHTTVTHRHELDALVYLELRDDPTDPLSRETSQRLRASAELLGLPLIEIRSNLMAFGRASGLDWNDFHGPALATVALLLSPQFSHSYIPATSTYANPYPLGSHPLLDPLWSTERVEIIHDGADATRGDKLRVIAEEPAARTHLQVCWEHRDGLYNCGRCEKCMRTAVGARIAGVEGRFESLPSPTLRQVAAVNIVGLGSAWIEHRNDLRRSGANPRLRGSIEIALWRRRLNLMRQQR